MPAYEGITPLQVEPSVRFAEALPLDRAAALKEIIDMVTAKIIPISFAQQLIKERLGYDVPADALQQVLQEQTTILDAVGARLGATDPNAAPNANDPTVA
jgi:hypothetical protein